jgi:hypothetical protein
MASHKTQNVFLCAITCTHYKFGDYKCRRSHTWVVVVCTICVVHGTITYVKFVIYMDFYL